MQSLSFMDSSNLRKHLLLVYDDAKAGQEVEFHFIIKGLENRENYIYLTHGSIKNIENEMRRFGIDVAYFKEQNLLHIQQISSPVDDPRSIFEGLNEILRTVIPDPDLPFRIVGRIIPDVGTEEAISIQAYIEKNFHNAIFEAMNGSVLCTYDISQIKANDKWKHWLARLEMYHHAYIASLDGRISVTMNQN